MNRTGECWEARKGTDLTEWRSALRLLQKGHDVCYVSCLKDPAPNRKRRVVCVVPEAEHEALTFDPVSSSPDGPEQTPVSKTS